MYGTSASGANMVPLGVRRRNKKDTDTALMENDQTDSGGDVDIARNKSSELDTPAVTAVVDSVSDRQKQRRSSDDNRKDDEHRRHHRNHKRSSDRRDDDKHRSKGRSSRSRSREKRRHSRSSRDRDGHRSASSRRRDDRDDHHRRSKRSRGDSNSHWREKSRGRDADYDGRRRDLRGDAPATPSFKPTFGPATTPSVDNSVMMNMGYGTGADHDVTMFPQQPGTPGSEGSVEDGKRKRRSRWGKENEKAFVPGMPTMLPSNLTEEQRRAYLLQLQIEELTRKLRTADYGIPANPEERSPSPEPVYDSHGKRLNTREVRMRQSLETRRHSLVVEMQKFNPNYKPPPDYKAPLTRLNAKVWIPQDNHPEINFVGLLIGPRGITLKQLETETGARIIIRGKGSVKDGKIAKREGPLPGEDEPLHAYITSADPQAIERAVKKIDDTIRQALELPDSENDFRKEQLRQLALLNGTLRGDELALTSFNRCSNCGANTHKSWECPDRPNVTANVYCTACGSAGHIAKDCKNPRPGGQAGSALDDEYSALMAELGEGGVSAGTPDIPGVPRGTRPILRVNLAVKPRPPPLMSMSTGFARMMPPPFGVPPLATPMGPPQPLMSVQVSVSGSAASAMPPPPPWMSSAPAGMPPPPIMPPMPMPPWGWGMPPLPSAAGEKAGSDVGPGQNSGNAQNSQASMLPPPPPPPMMASNGWPPMPMPPPMFAPQMVPPPPPPNTASSAMPPPPPPPRQATPPRDAGDQKVTSFLSSLFGGTPPPPPSPSR